MDSDNRFPTPTMLWQVLLSVAGLLLIGSVLFQGWAVNGTQSVCIADEGIDMTNEATLNVACNLARDNNEFACDLHRELAASTGGNLTCSPYSVSVALAMVHAGAVGNSRDEITETMHFKLDGPELYEAFACQSKLIDEQAGGVLANSAWVDESFALEAEYERLIKGTFESELATVDFDQVSQAIDRINGWTRETTNDRIKEIVTESEVKSTTVLVLVNCIDLDMQWDVKFADRQAGYQFTLADGTQVPVELMRRKSKCGYTYTDEYTAVRLGFKAGDSREMIVIVPNEHDGLAGLEAGLDAGFLAGLNEEFYPREVEAYLPPLAMESRHDLIPALKALGINDIFGMQADLSGISVSEGREIFVSAVVQQALTEVDEEGVKASAATAVSVSRKSAPQPPAKLVADRPFMFIVQDSRTGAALFMGRVADPSAL